MLSSVVPAGREVRRFLLGTLFSSLGLGLSLPFLLVYLTQVRGLNAGTVGVLVAATGVVGLAVTPLGGWLVDRVGARRVVLQSLLMVAVGTLSLAFVDGAVTGRASWIAIGGLGVAMWAGSSTILATLVAEHERQKAFGLNFTLVNLGVGIGGLIAGSFVDIAHPVTFQFLYAGDALSYLAPFALLLSMPAVGRRVGLNSNPSAPATAQTDSERTDVAQAERRSGGYRQ